jgi:DNA polymerase III subunit alpha
VKLRGAPIETYAAVLAKGDPVVITGKASFPRKDDDAAGDEEPEGAREATILLNDAVLLADAVKAATKTMTIRLPVATTAPTQLEKLRDVLAAWKGQCPVTLSLAMPDGAEAVLALGKEYRVEVGDPLLAGLERVFGEQVAELR